MKTQTSNNNKTVLSEPTLTTQHSNSIQNDACELIPNLNSKNSVEEQIKQITDQLFGRGINSTNRLPEMLNLLDDCADREVGWSVFHKVWNSCDATWNYCDDLMNFIDTMGIHSEEQTGPPTDYLSPEDREAFEALPNIIPIYRGCSLSKVYGLSWTTDRKIAEKFASGHRGISLVDPVIASLRIPKRHVIGFYTSRKESELLINLNVLDFYRVSVKKYYPM